MQHQRRSILPLPARHEHGVTEQTLEFVVLRLDLTRISITGYPANMQQKDQNNLDEALAWYAKAWDASRGPRTRVSLGGVYLARLLELSPDNPAAIRETGLLLLAEISDQNDWAQTHARTISRLGNRLLEWSRASASTV